MKSPFPGMDPYLERRWAPVHFQLLFSITKALRTVVSSDLRVRPEEDLIIEGDESGRRRADVAIVDFGTRPSDNGLRAATATLEESFLLQRMSDPTLHRWIEIRAQGSEGGVVTVIEVLSPWNKVAGVGNDAYLEKLTELERACVNVVELDLLRKPSRANLPTGRIGFKDGGIAPYAVCTWRAAMPNSWEVLPIRLRNKLPIISVPLRPGENEVPLDLQMVLEQAYAEAECYRDIDYSHDPSPPFTGDDQLWVAETAAQVKR